MISYIGDTVMNFFCSKNEADVTLTKLEDGAIQLSLDQEPYGSVSVCLSKEHIESIKGFINDL